MTIVHNMVTYEVGHLGDDSVLLAVGFAPSQEKIPTLDTGWFQIGMTRDRAVELAAALLRVAREPR